MEGSRLRLRRGLSASGLKDLLSRAVRKKISLPASDHSLVINCSSLLEQLYYAFTSHIICILS